MSTQSSPDKKLRTFDASDLGEMLIDAVLRDDKKVTKSALKSGACCRPCIAYALYVCVLCTHYSLRYKR